MVIVSGARSTLGCSDCKTNFTSASSLLRHFAEHISSNAAKEGSTESESDDARSESILERVLRSPTSATGSSPGDTSSPASTSDELNKKTSEEQMPEVSITKIEAVETATMPKYEVINNYNNNNKKHVMYVKLDLQKRVENCVNHLNGSSESTDEDSAKGESMEENNAVAETDDFNPLKFCVVTLEEGSEKIELNDTTLAKVGVNPVSGTVDPQQHYKKYVCSYCFKRFGWSTDLKRHILTHTGERPFQCQLCGATFTRNFLLQKHVLKLHKSAEPKLEDKAETNSQQNHLRDSALCLSKRRKQGVLADSGDKS
jgi:uncharacterized Zn-finger protein